MSSSNSKNSPRRWIFVFIVIAAGILAVVLYSKFSAKTQNSETATAEGVSVQSVRTPQRSMDTLVPAQEADSEEDPNDVGALIGNTALSDQELVKRLSVIVLNDSGPAESRSEALAHLLNLTTEEDESVLFTLAASPRLNEDLGDDLFRDSLNRSLPTQAELCLVLLGRKEASLRKEAQEHLIFLLDQDLGDKPAAWRAAVNTAKQRWKSTSD